LGALDEKINHIKTSKVSNSEPKDCKGEKRSFFNIPYD
jgi:hypothetical protein